MPKLKNSQRTRRCRQATVALACSVAVLFQSPVARAANQTWDGGGANAFWSNIANWLGDSAAPGDTVSTNNTDIAIFNAAVSGSSVIVDLNRNIGGINFDTQSGNYFISESAGNALKLSSGGAIQILSTLTATNITATINAPLSIQGANGTFTLANNSANGSGTGSGRLVFGGSIGGDAAGSTNLFLSGSNTNTNTISGIIGNGVATALGVTKNGAGTWVITGENTYSGATTINQGSLYVNSSAALGNGSATNTLVFNGGTLVASGAIASPATRAINFLGAATVNTSSYSVSLAGAITGAGGLTKTGTGTLFLTGAYDYTGSTTLSQGVLAVSTIGSGTNFIFGGGTLRYTGSAANFTRDFSINAGSMAEIEVSNRAATLSLSGFGGASTGGLIKSGLGTLTISGQQAYSGTTDLRGGTLIVNLGLGASNILSSSSPLTLESGALRLTGTGSQTFNSLTVANNASARILLGDSQTLSLGSAIIYSGSSVNFNTAVGGANASNSTLGTSVVVLNGQTVGSAINNSWTVTDSGGFGLATVNNNNRVVRLTSTALLPASGAGAATHYRIDNNLGNSATAGSSVLAITSSESALGITVDTTTTNGSATLASGVTLATNVWNFGGTGTNTWQISGSAGGAGIKSISANNDIQINNWSTGKITFNAPILASGFNSVAFLGSGTTVLAGANTYTGVTTVRAGTLEVPTGGAIIGGMVVGDWHGNDATLNIKGGSVSGSAGAIGNDYGITSTANVSAGSWTIGANFYVGSYGTGTLNLSGGTITSAVTYLGNTSAANGTANVIGGLWSISGSLSIGEGGTGALNLSGTGTITSNGGAVASNSGSTGTVIFTGGSWTINNNGLVIGSSGVGLFTQSGGTLNATGNVVVGQSGGRGTANISGGTWSIDSGNEIRIGTSGVLNFSGGTITCGEVKSSGAVTVSGGVWTATGTSFYVYESGAHALNVTGSGLIHVGGSGGTGTLYLGYNSGNTGMLNIGTGGAAGTLHAASVNAFLGTGVVNFNHTNNVSFTPAITGNVSVNKLGSGTTTLAAGNTYTGATTITAGTMLVSGTITGSAVTVSNTGSTLGGTGTVANVTVNSGASLQGGDGVSASGALTSGGGISLLDGSTIKLTLGTGGAHSQPHPHWRHVEFRQRPGIHLRLRRARRNRLLQ